MAFIIIDQTSEIDSIVMASFKVMASPWEAASLNNK